MSQVAKKKAMKSPGSEILKYAKAKEGKIIFNRIYRVKLPQTFIQLTKCFCIVLLSIDQTQLPGHIAGMKIQGTGKDSGGDILPEAKINTTFVTSNHPPQEHIYSFCC